MGPTCWPTWGRQDPGGPHVGPMNLPIRDQSCCNFVREIISNQVSLWIIMKDEIFKRTTAIDYVYRIEWAWYILWLHTFLSEGQRKCWMPECTIYQITFSKKLSTRYSILITFHKILWHVATYACPRYFLLISKSSNNHNRNHKSFLCRHRHWQHHKCVWEIVRGISSQQPDACDISTLALAKDLSLNFKPHLIIHS